MANSRQPGGRSGADGEGYLVSEFLYTLPLLACPLGMGAMMYFMMRGKKQDSPQRHQMSGSDELTRLRAEVDQLRAAQRETGHLADPAADSSDRA